MFKDDFNFVIVVLGEISHDCYSKVKSFRGFCINLGDTR